MPNNLLTKICISILALLIALPILAVMAAWLAPSGEMWAHFAKTMLADLLTSTAILLLGVAVGVGTLGTVLAYVVVMVQFPGRQWLQWALFLPFTIPAYVLAFVYLGVFDYAGQVQTYFRSNFGIAGFDLRASNTAIITVFVLAFYPYVYMIARASFQRQKRAIVEAGKVLGASPCRVFWRLSAPLARPAIAAGVLVTAMETLADFGVVSLFNYPTFTTAIYSAWSDFRSIALAAQLASLLVMLAFVLIYLQQKTEKGNYYGSDILQTTPYRATGVIGYLITLAVVAVLALSFVLPLLQLLVWSMQANDLALAQYSPAFLASLALTALATALTVPVAIILALPRVGSRYLNAIIRLATLGYALPGSVLAVGLLYGVWQIAAFLGDAWQYTLFAPLGLLLVAYMSRFTAVAHQSIAAAAKQIQPLHSQNATLLGAGYWRLLTKVYLPMLLPGILAGSLLVAVDVLKELPATYLLRPLGWDTLAVQVYELSSEGLFALASPPALLLVLLSTLLLAGFHLLDR